MVTQLEISEIRRQLGESIVGWVAEHQQLLNVPDPRSEQKWDPHIDQVTGFTTRNILAAPILSIHDGKLLGVLQVLNKHEGVFDDSDEKLIQAFATHAGTAIERQQLLEEIRRNAELQSAVEVGREIQSSFLPKVMPQIPHYELATWWEPAELVSGDYYDFVKLADNRLGIILADVSGHGVGPSLIMASFRAMFRVLIHPDLHEGRFITAILVAICPSTHELNFSNAAHAPALYLERKTGMIHKLETTNLPIGAIPEYSMQPGTPRKLQPGDLVILATDGLVELRNSAGEMFGTGRLMSLIKEHQALPAAQLRDRIKQAIHEFHPDPHLPDDITLVLVERKGA